MILYQSCRVMAQQILIKELKKIKKVLTSFLVCDNILKLSHESETELKQTT